MFLQKNSTFFYRNNKYKSINKTKINKKFQDDNVKHESVGQKN